MEWGGRPSAHRAYRGAGCHAKFAVGDWRARAEHYTAYAIQTQSTALSESFALGIALPASTSHDARRILQGGGPLDCDRRHHRCVVRCTIAATGAAIAAAWADVPSAVGIVHGVVHGVVGGGYRRRCCLPSCAADAFGNNYASFQRADAPGAPPPSIAASRIAICGAGCALKNDSACGAGCLRFARRPNTSPRESASKHGN